MRSLLLSWMILLACPLVAQPIGSVKAWLGVQIEDHPKGVLVKMILGDSPARIAEMKPGDIVFKIQKVEVRTAQKMIQTVQSFSVGDTVEVHFLRAEKPMVKKIALVAKPGLQELFTDRLLNKPAPDFDLKLAYGNGTGSLKALKGKAVFIEFWATWCPACVSTHGHLSQFSLKMDPKKGRVLAISDEDKSDIEAYAERIRAGFAMPHDEGSKVAGLYGVPALPAVVVIDQKGIVRYAAVGAGRYYEKGIEKMKELLK